MARSSERIWKFGPALELVVIAQLGRGHQSTLAGKMGMQPAAVSQHFSGLHPMSEATIHKIATALDMPYEELLTRGLDLLAKTAENDGGEEAEEDDRPAPRSSTKRAAKPASVRQPPHSTKAEVEAASPPSKLKMKTVARPATKPEARPAPRRAAKR